MLKRDATNITISEFYERHLNAKYNYDPSYQRRSDVWTPEKKSFLIDTILRNYPIPPIFLHQKIDDEQGATKYDVIDGKQRLLAIREFIDGTIQIPEDFDEGTFGNFKLKGLYFSELIDGLAEYKRVFWRYRLPIEYIYAEGDMEDVLYNIFDRLNRNGEPLNPQELRNAKYHDSDFLKLVNELSHASNWKEKLNNKVKFNRMDIEEFVSDLLILQHVGIVGMENSGDLDKYYSDLAIILNPLQIDKLKQQYVSILNFVNSLDLDFSTYRIMGVSHIYAIWSLVIYCMENNITSENIKFDINAFYSAYRYKHDDECVVLYRKSMEMRTKSKSQREKRIDALKKFCIHK